MERQYRNLGYFSLLLVAFVGLGFYKPYFSLIPDFGPDLTPLVQVHAMVLICLVVLLVVQPFLIRYGKRALHRTLGKLTYVVMPLLVFSCVGVVMKEYHERLHQNLPPIIALKSGYSDVAQLCLLVVFYALAIINRRNIPVHMRYMIAVVLILAPAGLARVFGYWFDIPRFPSGLATDLLLDAVLIGLIIFDRRNKLNYRPYLLVLALFVVSHIGFIAVYPR